MAKRICKGSPEHEDVAHYVITSFMEHPRAEELIGKGEAMKFMSGMIHLSYYSSTSPYHTLYRQKGRIHELYESNEEQHCNTAWDSCDDAYSYEKDLANEAIEGILEEMQAEGIEQWYRSVLFSMWINNPNYSDLARQTDIPRSSISQAVNECIEHIKQQLKNRNINYDL